MNTTLSAPTASIVQPHGVIRLELAGDVHEFSKSDAASEYIKALCASYTSARHCYRDARLLLGRALVQVRGQLPHGTWTEFLAELAINRKTAWSLMSIAEAYTNPAGLINVASVRASQVDALNAGRDCGYAITELCVCGRAESITIAELKRLLCVRKLIALGRWNEIKAHSTIDRPIAAPTTPTRTESTTFASTVETFEDDDDGEVEWESDDDPTGGDDAFELVPTRAVQGVTPTTPTSATPAAADLDTHNAVENPDAGASGEQLTFDAMWIRVKSANQTILELTSKLAEFKPQTQARIAEAMERHARELVQIKEGN